MNPVIKSFVEFLFPKSAHSLELENLSAEELLNIPPPVEEIKDKNIFALLDYKHPLAKGLVWEIKYKGNKDLAGKMGMILYDAILDEVNEKRLFDVSWKSEFLLIPIPTHAEKLFERGWNQAELLTEKVAAQDLGKNFKYLPGELIKIKLTKSQTKTTSKSERLENIKNSIGLRGKEIVTGKCIVLIDDVTTTGATFNEARRALQEAGAKDILCFAVAH